MRIKPKTSPIYQTSVFSFDDLNELEVYYAEPSQGYIYSRFANPNSEELAAKISYLEKGSGAVVTSSGMSAIFTAILSYCQAGDHILASEELYGGSTTLLTQELSRVGIDVTYLPIDQLYQLESFVRSNTKLVLAETMSNPLLRVIDISRLAKECQQSGIALVIDNTFATPIITRPLELGADVVIHSVTKYISGHSDVTAGVAISKDQQYQRMKQIMVNYGMNLSPFESWLATRGLKTLKLRLQQHSANASELAHFLQQHPKVKKVYYPGLPEHPDHDLATRQGHGLFGGMLSFQLEDNLEVVNRFMRACSTISFSPSLAGVDTSISHPLKTSHRGLTAEQQVKLGITMGLIRLSVGIEEVAELKAELTQVLDSI